MKFKYSGVNKIMKPTQIKAVLAQHKISEFIGNDVQSTAYEIDIEEIVPHPEYRCDNPENDIGLLLNFNFNICHIINCFKYCLALLKVSKPIVFSGSVKPACIAINQNNINDYDGLVATVSGWGWTNEDQNIGKLIKNKKITTFD